MAEKKMGQLQYINSCCKDINVSNMGEQALKCHMNVKKAEPLKPVTEMFHQLLPKQQ